MEHAEQLKLEYEKKVANVKAELNKELKNHEKEIDSRQEKIKFLDAQLSDKKTMNNLSNQMAEFITKISKLTVENAHLTKDFENLTGRFKEVSMDHAELS